MHLLFKTSLHSFHYYERVYISEPAQTKRLCTRFALNRKRVFPPSLVRAK